MQLTLPSGVKITPPSSPHTWIEQAGVVFGDPLSAKTLEADVGAAVAWHRQRPQMQGINNVGTSLTTSTWTGQPLAEIVDTAAGHNDATNTTRWYAPETANATDWYLCSNYVPMSSTSAAQVHIAGFRIDGAGTIFEGGKLTSGAGHYVTPLALDLLQMTSDGTHYAEPMGYQQTGGSISTPTTLRTPSFNARWVCSGSGTVVALPSSPRTWTSADALTADTTGAGKVPLNLHIRDLLRFLNYPPIARLTSQGTAQTIATGAGSWTSIALPTATVDNYTGWSSGTNTKYTCQRAGLYIVGGTASVADTGANAGYRASRILHTIAAGGSAVYNGAAVVPPTGTSSGTHLPVASLIRMAVNDTLELQLSHTQGGNLSVQTSANNCSRLIAVWRSL